MWRLLSFGYAARSLVNGLAARRLFSHLVHPFPLSARHTALRRTRHRVALLQPARCLTMSTREAATSSAADSPSHELVSAETARAMLAELSGEMRLPALRAPVALVDSLQKMLRKKNLVLQLPLVKRVLRSPDGSSGHRLILLEEGALEKLPEAVRSKIRMGEVSTTDYTMVMEARHYSVEELFKRILPEGMEAVTSFETVGHIAHMNLRDEHLPFKHVIGETILLKNPKLRTVVNKLGNINAIFRTFDMEVIAGDDDLIAEVCYALLELMMRQSENNCRFRMHYPDVYWNSRLGDMFAGIGPFAIPAAKAGIQVYANDLNPNSCHWMRENKRLNKIGPHLHVYNMDGRDFVRKLVSDGVRFTQVFMNLPASAEKFLDSIPFHSRRATDTFIGLFPESFRPLPVIHCYGFAPLPDPIENFRQRVEVELGTALPSDAVISEVRNVSPKKHMICAKFRLPEVVAYRKQEAEVGEKRSAEEASVKGNEAPAKRLLT